MNWYLKVLNNYFGFSGRARRMEYWMFILFNEFFSSVAWILDKVLKTAMEDSGNGLFLILYNLAVFLPWWAVTVRRLHDVGRSGWMMLILVIPLIGWIWFLILLIIDSDPGGNKYGPNPKEV